MSFISFLSRAAYSYNLAIGLKNSLEILPDVRGIVDFAVNEECVSSRECDAYTGFTTREAKPVFHIEYPVYLRSTAISDADRRRWCAESVPLLGDHTLFQTVLKVRSLDGWVTYCNGSTWSTPTKEIPNSRFSDMRRRALEGEEPEGMPPRAKYYPADDAGFGEWLRKVAVQDGYPFPPGRGSELEIPDEALGCGPRRPTKEWILPTLRPMLSTQTTTLVSMTRSSTGPSKEPELELRDVPRVRSLPP